MKAKHMLPVSRRTDKSSTTALPLLCNGDRLTQPEFHRRYLTYPDDAHFELIGGIVYVPSPQRMPHSDYDGELGFIFAGAAHQSAARRRTASATPQAADWEAAHRARAAGTPPASHIPCR